ncbi:hypothetical protein DCAR_0729375 [Daucus carota subsp. sativus]|uniref:Uncharacterized protein n=1 Tax=Daucus carota subsp. sativus TaxID=79200 RepID=A0A161Y7V4_DAUCS|nr:hypothetical protein DCAR_0729375 [Daucus carota subsp. sativus]
MTTKLVSDTELSRGWLLNGKCLSGTAVCFELARQARLLQYNNYGDRDLYVTGDLSKNDVVTQAMIVVPRCRVSQLRTKKGLTKVFYNVRSWPASEAES